MNILLTGILIGFFTAIFASMYSEYFFNLKLPIILIYGVIGPFLSALAVLIIELARRNMRSEWERQEEDVPERILAASERDVEKSSSKDDMEKLLEKSEKWIESGDEEKRRRHEKQS